MSLIPPRVFKMKKNPLPHTTSSNDGAISLNEFQTDIEELILKTSVPGKHCARNAIAGIKKAWEIRHIDSSMAVFRIITAEEEAATAIFHALKRRKYVGADKLNARNHVHKHAVVPLLQMVVSYLVKTTFFEDLKPQIVWSKEKGDAVIRARVTTAAQDGTSVYVYPMPPLGFEIVENDSIYNFDREFEEMASLRNVKHIMKEIQDVANRRNRILYAEPRGIPNAAISEKGLLKKKDVIFNLLVIFLLIEQHKEKQLFVQQALNVLLKMLKIVPSDVVFQ